MSPVVPNKIYEESILSITMRLRASLSRVFGFRRGRGADRAGPKLASALPKSFRARGLGLPSYFRTNQFHPKQ